MRRTLILLYTFLLHSMMYAGGPPTIAVPITSYSDIPFQHLPVDADLVIENCEKIIRKTLLNTSFFPLADEEYICHGFVVEHGGSNTIALDADPNDQILYADFFVLSSLNKSQRSTSIDDIFNKSSEEPEPDRSVRITLTYSYLKRQYSITVTSPSRKPNEEKTYETFTIKEDNNSLCPFAYFPLDIDGILEKSEQFIRKGVSGTVFDEYGKAKYAYRSNGISIGSGYGGDYQEGNFEDQRLNVYFVIVEDGNTENPTALILQSYRDKEIYITVYTPAYIKHLGELFKEVE